MFSFVTFFLIITPPLLSNSFENDLFFVFIVFSNGSNCGFVKLDFKMVPSESVPLSSIAVDLVSASV